MKILLATQKPFSQAAVLAIRGLVETAGHTLATLEDYKTQTDLAEAVKQAEALIVRSDLVSSEIVAAAPALQIVVRAGAGYDNVDLKACTAAGIVVMNTPGQNSNAVAELAVGLMIYAARNFFSPGTGTELRGRSLGLQAYGNVGRLVAAHGRGLGMTVSAFDPFVPTDSMEKDNVQPVQSLEALYEACDYVSLHIPALPSTIGSVGHTLMSRMPAGATLLNTARKEIINEAGLAQTLAERPDLKYISDVMPDNYPLLREKFPQQIYATPKKMGAETAEANENSGRAAAEQIIKFFATGDTTYQVNP